MKEKNMRILVIGVGIIVIFIIFLFLHIYEIVNYISFDEARSFCKEKGLEFFNWENNRFSAKVKCVDDNYNLKTFELKKEDGILKWGIDSCD